MHRRSVVLLWLAVDEKMLCYCLLKWRYEYQSFYYSFSLLIYLKFPFITIINYFQLSSKYLNIKYFFFYTFFFFFFFSLVDLCRTLMFTVPWSARRLSVWTMLICTNYFSTCTNCKCRPMMSSSGSWSLQLSILLPMTRLETENMRQYHIKQDVRFKICHTQLYTEYKVKYKPDQLLRLCS